jgi:hypothetical protein
MRNNLFATILLIVTSLISFSGRAQTEFKGETGIYGHLLNDLKTNLYVNSRVEKVLLDGKERLMFVEWVRDHIHTMKAYKYWEKDLASYIAFFMEHQTEKGMYFDYWDSYKNKNVGQLYFTNCFDRQFYYVDVNQQNFFFRMPMEADLEYLLVEGVFTNWQATGDIDYVKKWLPTLVKGMKYLMNDPLRWSADKMLVKRPYTIDTWDFTSQHDSLKGVEKLLGHIDNTEKTPKGIMHGDNSGMFMACKMLAKLFNVANDLIAAREWDVQGDLFFHRLNNVCWNGKYYAHFITEDPYPIHIKSDPLNSIGLSNTYSMNRGSATPEMAASIIKAYQEIGEKTKAESMAPWYGIYPFIQPHFGNYAVGEYMNGAILPLVGGELCKAAFQYGFEKYAVEQLNILDQLLSKNNRRLAGCISTDGTPQQEAIPDEWGQAAFVSALVEGLAGVVDKSLLFQEVEISPRWYFAGVEKTSVTVGYGSDGNQVSYDYNFNPKNKQVEIKTQGKFDAFTLRVPFPEKSKSATGSINGSNVKVAAEMVNQSRYAVVKGKGNANIVVLKFN